MSEVKNIVVVGGGRWGKNLIRNFHELGALHTICDPNEALLDRYQEQYPDIQVTSNYKNILKNPLLTRLDYFCSCNTPLSIGKTGSFSW